MSERFIDNCNGTVTDTSTGLMWQKETASEMYAWDDALKYCKALDLAGYKDWRLPRMNELQHIIDYEYFAPAINPVFEVILSFYWSSSTHVGYQCLAWSLSCYDGSVIYSDKCHEYFVRAVRSGKELQ